jgi:Plasmid encoded RepA protein
LFASMAPMSKQEERDLFGPRRLSEGLPKLKPLSRVKQRLIESAVQIEAEDPESITYQHTVFCQTGLPYRDPGPQVREWKRRQGNVALKVSAGEAMNPETGNWVELAIPFGPKPRLILTHLNREALIHTSPEVEVEDSLTAFMKRILGFDPNGKEIRKFKDQLARLAASMIRLAVMQGDRAFQIDTKVVTAFDLWFPKDQRQRVLWPSTVRLSLDYFESLQRHAVPLDERAVAALSHSAMGLDIYAWLAQRLHRVDPGKPVFIPWNAIKEQFGHQYARMDNFKRVFRHTLDMVLTQYRAARIELDGRGMTLRNSSPPIKGRVAIVRRA